MMKPHILISVTVLSFLVTSDGDTIRNSKKQPKYYIRCRRYLPQYYPPRTQNLYNVPPGYYEPRVYVPSRCYTYCYSCATSSCRRRCPNTSGYRPQALPYKTTPTVGPYVRTTPRSRTTSRRWTTATPSAQVIIICTYDYELCVYK
ncbi:unnamed protein product [Acanthoscelides obtectus]|uniref:Uncharacterized protein n=1 Tax=Acanthoscelides obtectus TaxID=200917 RepID=A0A9P0KQP5_ACAOB|nr:unnamed protein product [Acanthoscelides obtectus]CAK1670223.1 hypothetical protein AOBTE_LOCUS27490 [Acanthoscelides obtectus]